MFLACREEIDRQAGNTARLHGGHHGLERDRLTRAKSFKSRKPCLNEVIERMSRFLNWLRFAIRVSFAARPTDVESNVSFTLGGGGKFIRVISARTMHRKERLRYEQEA